MQNAAIDLDEEAIAAAAATQRGLLDSLVDLGRDCDRALDRQDTHALLAVLDERRDMLTRVAQIGQTLAGRGANVRGAALRAALRELDEMVDQIAADDIGRFSRMQEERGRIALAMRGAHAGRRAAAAYGGVENRTNAISPRVQDERA